MQGLDSHASRTEQKFPKIILGKEVKINFLGKKDPVYKFWLAVKVVLAMQRAYYKSIARLIT